MPEAYAGLRYAVPFFRNDDLWQGFWNYTKNLKTADRFDWENTEDLIEEYFKKEDFVLERIPRLVSFLSKVGEKRFRVKLGPNHNPTKDFCEKFAEVLESSSLSSTFHYRLAYEYVANTEIEHEWIGYIFSYKGPYKKVVLRALSDALLDHYIADPYTKYPLRKEGTNYKKLFAPLYKRIDQPEMLPIPLYKALLCCRKVSQIRRWTLFTRNNLDIGRNEEEKSKAIRFLILNTLRVAKSKNVFDVETRNEALNSLLLTKDSSEMEYQARFLWKLLRNCRYRVQYVFFRRFINDELFKSKYKKLMVKKNVSFRIFVRAYEGDDRAFPHLSLLEQLMAYPHLKENRKKVVLEKAKQLISKPIDWVDRQDELFYALKVTSLGDREFLRNHIFDPVLEKSSFLSNKLRTYYLVKLHVLRFKNAFKKHWHFFFLKIISTRIGLLDYYLGRV
ncbi:MAG: hypothetical protein K6G74_03970 [Bacilli bacterium]|nr:hypothetical protein [Bacilli bacterium]